MAELIELTDLPQGHLSFTSYNMFLRCGRQYWFRYIQGLKCAVTSQLVLGAAAAHSLEWDFGQHLTTGAHPPTAKLLDYYAAALPIKAREMQEESRADLVMKSGDTDERLLDDGVRLLDLYDREVGVTLSPAAVEEEFEVEMSTGYRFVGVKDLRLAGSGSIVDHKTTKKGWPEGAALYDPQLTGYDICETSEGRAPEELQLHVLVRLRDSVRYEIHRAPGRTPAQRQEFLENLGDVATSIKAGLFPKTNAYQATCSWCGYADRCRPDFARAVAAHRAEED